MTSPQVFEDLWTVLHVPGFFHLHLDGRAVWLSTESRARFRRTLGGSEKLGSRAQLSPVPRFGFERRSVGDSAVLWVRSETGEETEALLSWSPTPTFIFRDGSTVRHTAIWALTGELDPHWTLRLNKRLAHAIGTAKKHSDPANFYFTPPGSKDDKDKASQIVHMAPDFYGAKELAGRLPDAPNPKLAYRRRQEALAA